jgi:hypothetical protein
VIYYGKYGFWKEFLLMAIQKLSAFEKTSIQLRHTLKRLEVFVEIARSEEEVALANEMIVKLKEVRAMIPADAQDVDIRERN